MNYIKINDFESKDAAAFYFSKVEMILIFTSLIHVTPSHATGIIPVWDKFYVIKDLVDNFIEDINTLEIYVKKLSDYYYVSTSIYFPDKKPSK